MERIESQIGGVRDGPLRPFAATSGNLGSRLASSSNPLIIGNGRS